MQNEESVSRKIQVMTDFVLQESRAKAEEIIARATEQFTADKLHIVESRKVKIEEEHTARLSGLESRERIIASVAGGQAELKFLTARDQLLQKLRHEVIDRLAHADDAELIRVYTQLLKQALAAARPGKLVLTCRATDRTVADAAIAAAGEGRVVLGDGELSDMCSGPCSGGFVLSTEDGKVGLRQVFDERVEAAVKALMPQLRTILFD